ncbi:MAG: LysM peptidoglycan-binding domain-containing protein [Candidatus Hydrogenedentes bacterium]|nr:LysM peptidoglycan-binding domain-containing protein [Candidatus Hydrogenedentota bacterium]
MTNEPENEFDDIEKKLGEGLGDDPRLSSGVPQDQRGSDIEFIQMSGLVRPSIPPVEALPPAPDDLDSTRPVSFFEKGIADVDADMVPGSVEDRSVANQEIRPVPQAQSPMSHLRDIIADLTKDATPPAPDPALMAQFDATPDESPAEEVESIEAEPAVSLEDVQSEVGSAHPMQREVEAVTPSEAAPEPVAPLMPIAREAEYFPPAEELAQETPPEPAAPVSAPSPVYETSPVPAPEPEPAPVSATAPAPEPHIEPERPIRPAPVLPGHTAELAEAERLLDELEPVPASSRFDEEPEEYAKFDTRSLAAEAEEIPDGTLDYKQQGKRRHRSTNKNGIKHSLARLAASLLVVSGLAVATYTGYLWIQQRMASPDQLFRQATRFVQEQNYAAASRMFEDFASLHPNNPLRPEAQFNAAFAMQMQPANDADAAKEIRGQALRLFEQYRKDNPTHAKVARAETLMGRLNYESGRYAEAIELLRNPELRLRDPASAVPALRTLARASAKMGDAEAARSYYLQAVGVQGNHSPDVDYAELGSLYQTRADHAEDLDKRIELQQLAIESWTHALEVPGIDPASKQTIRSQLDVLRERLQSEPGMAPAMESLNDIPVETPQNSAALDTPPAPEPAAPSGSEPAMDSHAPAAEEHAPAEAPNAAAQDAQTPVQDAHAPAPDGHVDPTSNAHATAAPPAPEAKQEHAAAAEHAGAEPAATNDGEYVVKHGDTLTSIATSLHTTVDELKELNALKGDTVFEGQHLLVPAGEQ